jgi:hypothetical protein
MAVWRRHQCAAEYLGSLAGLGGAPWTLAKSQTVNAKAMIDARISEGLALRARAVGVGCSRSLRPRREMTWVVEMPNAF